MRAHSRVRSSLAGSFVPGARPAFLAKPVLFLREASGPTSRASRAMRRHTPAPSPRIAGRGSGVRGGGTVSRNRRPRVYFTTRSRGGARHSNFSAGHNRSISGTSGVQKKSAHTGPFALNSAKCHRNAAIATRIA